MKRLVLVLLASLITLSLSASNIVATDKRTQVQLTKKNSGTIFKTKRFQYTFGNTSTPLLGVFVPIPLRVALDKKNIKDTYSFFLDATYRFFKNFNITKLDGNDLSFLILSKESEIIIKAQLSKSEIMRLKNRDFSEQDLIKKETGKIIPLKEILKNAKIYSSGKINKSIYKSILMEYNFAGFTEGIIEDAFYKKNYNSNSIATFKQGPNKGVNGETYSVYECSNGRDILVHLSDERTTYIVGTTSYLKHNITEKQVATKACREK